MQCLIQVGEPQMGPNFKNMIMKFFDQFPGKITSQNLTEIELFTGFVLPEAYKKYLLKNNGGRVKSDCFRTIHNEMESVIHFFYGVTNKNDYDLKQSYIRWTGHDFPSEYFPIANDVFGNYIVLDLLKDTAYGQVLFWSHDTPELRPVEISGDFDSFLKGLYKETLEKTELDIAVDRQDIKYFQNRIANGEYIDNIKNNFGQTAVIAASLRGKLRLVEFFHKIGSTMDKALFSAASNGHYDTVKYLITLGLSPDERDVTQNNDTALIQAAYGGHIDIVRLLIKAGADINAMDKFGQSVLRKAYWSNNDELVSYLEKLGAKG